MDKMIKSQVEELSSLWHRLLDVNRKCEFERAFPNLNGLTTNEISLIRMVSQDSEIILRDICEKLNLPKSTLTNMVNRLEKKGYIERIISQKDLRSYGLALTKKGELVQEEHLKCESFVYGSILESLSNNEKRESLIVLMNEIVDHLEQKF